MEMKNCPNGQEVSQSLLVDIPAVTENHRDCDVGNHWNVHWKTVSRVEIMRYITEKFSHCLTSEFHVKFHAKTDIAGIANCIAKATWAKPNVFYFILLDAPVRKGNPFKVNVRFLVLLSVSGFFKFSKILNYNSRFGRHSFSVNLFISKVFFFPNTSCIFVSR